MCFLISVSNIISHPLSRSPHLHIQYYLPQASSNDNTIKGKLYSICVIVKKEQPVFQLISLKVLFSLAFSSSNNCRMIKATPLCTMLPWPRTRIPAGWNFRHGYCITYISDGIASFIVSYGSLIYQSTYIRCRWRVVRTK